MALYFAYGSNLDERQMKQRCPSCKFKTEAYVPGYTIAFTRCSDKRHGGVADIVQCPHEVVWGVVYELSDEDVGRLDKCEGYCGEGHSNAYERKDCDKQGIPVLTGKGHQLKGVFTYIANRQRDFLPHKVYRDQIINGAKRWKLPREYVEKLESLPFSETEIPCPLEF